MYTAIMGFKKFLIRALRNGTKQLKMKCPMTSPDISIIGMEEGRIGVCKKAWKGPPEKEATDSGL